MRAPMGRLACCAVAVLAVSGCLIHPVAIAEKLGVSGWAQVDRGPGPPKSAYRERFELLPLAEPRVKCADLALPEAGPVYVVIHGIGGDGPEFEDAVPVLAATKPAALYLFRWVPYDGLDRIGASLGVGLSKLLACRPRGEVIVLAHSAGGIVASYGASRVRVPSESPDDAVTVVTVASPLAGNVNRARAKDGAVEGRFMLDLGSRITEYPPAPRGVRGLHLRTSYPADNVMKPNGDFIPNDPKVGIPGARQVSLPAELGHVEAYGYVVRKFADGTWLGWLENP